MITNVLPWPSLDSTAMAPLCCSMMLWHMESPRPVPLPTSFVVKNGSKIFGMSSFDMPWPLSFTFMVILSLVFVMDMSIWPDFFKCFMASLAFKSRFVKTCSKIFIHLFVLFFESSRFSLQIPTEVKQLASFFSIGKSGI